MTSPTTTESLLATFPATARVWIYQADREFRTVEIQTILTDSARFIAQWAAHGTPIKAMIDIAHQRFLILCADQEVMKASGCSIDASVHFIQGLGEKLDIDFFDRMTICYLKESELKSCSMMEITDLLSSGELSADTIVFDNLVATKVDFDDRWTAPLRSTWMSRYL